MYVPPDVGYTAANWAEATALQYAISAAITRPTSRPVPAVRAAGPNAAKIPAPIIDPRPMATAPPVPSRRSRWSVRGGADWSVPPTSRPRAFRTAHLPGTLHQTRLMYPRRHGAP